MSKKQLGFGSLMALLTVVTICSANAQPTFHYTVSFPDPASHSYHVSLSSEGWDSDSIVLKIPRWMPGYYQYLPYFEDISNFHVDAGKKPLKYTSNHLNSWTIESTGNKNIQVEYDVHTSKQFVANSYVDSAHAYLIPENSFLYAEEFIKQPVTVSISPAKGWSAVATGLTRLKEGVYAAKDFDILYDCPILTGRLDSLPDFEVEGVPHRFIGYQLGDFDRELFRKKLSRVVRAAVDIIGDIPYEEYSFIAIGAGRGGIEHLNNTTVSFTGSQVQSEAGMHGIMNFLAHEYFHHYNVKRIRPFELGPFDYEAGSKTNLLWVSEGLSVYYEYMITARAGISNEQLLLKDFERNINQFENNPGKVFQSLEQASYATWSDGPFGASDGKTISYYIKGPVVGLMLDFYIRDLTDNERSLDDVMRRLYWRYYKELGRGFTDAEFQQTCEAVAGKPLTDFFEYISSTRPLDYDQYLAYGGLQLTKEETRDKDGKPSVKFTLSRMPNPSKTQEDIYAGWLKGR